MQKIIFILMLFFSACIFTPEEPQLPSERFVDRFNLNQIAMLTQNARFSFQNYRELFRDSDNLYVDFTGRSFPGNRFISRLNLINTDAVLSCSWSAESSGEPTFMNAPTTLNIRRFVIAAEIGERTGDVKITIEWSDMLGWQITEWREIGDNFSFFHPDNLGN